MIKTSKRGRASSQILEQKNGRVQFLEWNFHIKSLDRISDFAGEGKREAEESLEYLQKVLGKDFLSKASAGDAGVARHPMLATLANLAACSRGEIARFADAMRTLEGSENLERMLGRLYDSNTFMHNELVIKSAAKLVMKGLRVSFEPTLPERERGKQPDLRLEDPVSGETVFVEVSTQTPAKREREATDVNSAVIDAVYRISYELCFSARWYMTPSTAALGQILETIRSGATRALAERIIVEIREQGILEMAVCHRDEAANQLDPWCAERGLSPGGFLGPAISTNDAVRIRWKIGKEQKQLPRDYANVVVILASDVFHRAGGLRRVVSEIEDAVFKNDQIHLVIIHGQYIDESQVSASYHGRGHRYTRRVNDGLVEDDLVLVNRDARMKLSNGLLEKFYEIF